MTARLAFVALSFIALATPALADPPWERHRERDYYEHGRRGWDRDDRRYGRDERWERERYAREEWRERHARPGYYAPPPVYYAPPPRQYLPPPGVGIYVPFR